MVSALGIGQEDFQKSSEKVKPCFTLANIDGEDH